VQSEGDLSPDSGSVGAVFPRAIKQGTVNLPAAHPSLIAVGASINRTEWQDYVGEDVRIGQLLDLPIGQDDSLAFFSSAGPTSQGLMKPDIVAPGDFVIGAMAQTADPRAGKATMFSGGGWCGDLVAECFVVDNRHAVSSGTSMAAPLVSGAVALLFERDPSLTQPEIKRLLAAGARRPQGVVLVEQQMGPGALDLMGTLQVQRAEQAMTKEGEPDPTQSFLSLASAHLRPDGVSPLRVVAQLRTASGAAADGFEAKQIGIETERARVIEPLSRVAPGHWRFGLVAEPGTGQATAKIRLLYRGQPLLERTVPIAVDPLVARGGAEARGGCAIGKGLDGGRQRAGWLLFALACVCTRRRSSRRLCAPLRAG
jgi:hypothetical protein